MEETTEQKVNTLPSSSQNEPQNENSDVNAAPTKESPPKPSNLPEEDPPSSQTQMALDLTLVESKSETQIESKLEITSRSELNDPPKVISEIARTKSSEDPNISENVENPLRKAASDDLNLDERSGKEETEEGNASYPFPNSPTRGAFLNEQLLIRNQRRASAIIYNVPDLFDKVKICFESVLKF